MAAGLRYPHIVGRTEREQIAELKSYLYELVDVLEFSLSNTSAPASTGVEKAVSVDSITTFNAIKPLIIRSSDIINAYYAEVVNRMDNLPWISRALSAGVSESTVSSGRWGGTGVCYKVSAGGKHVYIAFNVSFSTSAGTIRVESETIPFPPSHDVKAICSVGFADGSLGIATVGISPVGEVNIYAVHQLPGAALSTGETVTWIDGYIDYWI